MSEYQKAIAARKARQKAMQVARKQKQAMRYTTEGDFVHLGKQPMNLRRG